MSPSIKWSPVKNVVSYALIFEDPDAVGGNFIHWYVPYISNSLNQLLSLNHEKEVDISKIYNKINYSKIRLIQGKNTLDKFSYTGPCAPKGTGIHNYKLRIYALDKIFRISDKTSSIKDSKQFEDILQRNGIKILDRSMLTFKYGYF
jgi:hypothetical protein